MSTTVTLDGTDFVFPDDFDNYGFRTKIPELMQAWLNQQTTGFSPTVVSVTGATKTIGLSDKNTIQECNRGTAQTITIPTNASVAFAVGDVIVFEQIGAGQVTIAGDTGVTINGVSGGNVSISAQYLSCYLRKVATDTWIAIGSLT